MRVGLALTHTIWKCWEVNILWADSLSDGRGTLTDGGQT